jgi:hypothetical protein
MIEGLWPPPSPSTHARHRRPTGLIHQALQTSQVLSFRETLYSMGIGETGNDLLP